MYSSTDSFAEIVMHGPVEKHHRRLPHWTKQGAIYFITFRVLRGELDSAARKIVLDHALSGGGRFYILFAVVVMPDHVHLLIQPLDGFDLSRIMKGIKGVSARSLNKYWNQNGNVWQDESFDRIIRDQDDFNEKLGYMLNNPVKRELTDDGWKWDGWYCRPNELG